MKEFFNILVKYTSNNKTVAEKEVDSFDEMTLTTCVLLIEVSMSDDNYDEQEKEKIIGILRTKYNLDEKQINVLMEIASKKNKEMISLYDWTSQINSIFSYEEKKELIKSLWDVAFADGRIDKYEDYTLSLIHI